MQDIRKRFGDRIRQLRNDRGWSQEELADRAGLHRTYIGSVERGEQNLSLVNIERLAATLGVSLAELFAPFDVNSEPVSPSDFDFHLSFNAMTPTWLRCPATIARPASASPFWDYEGSWEARTGSTSSSWFWRSP